MKIFKNLAIPNYYKKSALAIGNFDGVHKGHQKVFKYAKKFAKRSKSKFGILTFSPLPVMFFNKRVKNYRLTYPTFLLARIHHYNLLWLHTP